jgi:hypothetical protein
MQCDGSGYCLTVKALLCTHECRREPCPNVDLCGNEEPRFLLEFNRGVCNTCASAFGCSLENPSPSADPVLPVSAPAADRECPVCLTNDVALWGQPRCCHMLCVSCLRVIYGWESLEEGPPFPLPSDQEDEYYDNPNVFLNDPTIQSWKLEMGSWRRQRLQFILQNQRFIKHCPVCRQ